MNLVGVKQTERRFEVVDVANLGIKAYGNDNLYPQRIKAVVAASMYGTVCTRRYGRFIEGGGFADKKLWSYIVNQAGQTMDDILRLIAADRSLFGGYALHINYNALGQVCELNHVPFENCRLCTEDDNNYVSKIAVFADWSGKSKRKGKALKPTPDSVDYIDVFNPNAAMAQLTLSGVENYKGQIHYYSSSGVMVYPTPVVDSIVTDLSTDEGLGNVRYRNVRNNFLPAGLLCKRRNSRYTESENEAWFADLGQFQGDEKAGKIIGVDLEEGEEPPAFTPFDSNNTDKDYETAEKSVEKHIYAAFEQEPFLRMAEGAVGFSSKIISDTYNYYSSLVSNEQYQIERSFTSIFKCWFEEVSSDFSILSKNYDTPNRVI